MFTGIIEILGNITHVKGVGDGKEFSVSCSSDFLAQVKLGDSIAINGACQTVIRLGQNSFDFFSSRQTLELTNLGQLMLRDPVNLEKALQVGSRLDGHLVAGHVDGVGVVSHIEKQRAGYLFSFELPEALLSLVVEKGSITVDGISLTIYSLNQRTVTVSVIPHTFENTTLKLRKKGDSVNLESDLLGKYVVRFLTLARDGKAPDSSSLETLLKDNGFWN